MLMSASIQCQCGLNVDVFSGSQNQGVNHGLVRDEHTCGEIGGRSIGSGGSIQSTPTRAVAIVFSGQVQLSRCAYILIQSDDIAIMIDLHALIE